MAVDWVSSGVGTVYSIQAETVSALTGANGGRGKHDILRTDAYPVIPGQAAFRQQVLAGV
jgi:hypothetical protein